MPLRNLDKFLDRSSNCARRSLKRSEGGEQLRRPHVVRRKALAVALTCFRVHDDEASQSESNCVAKKNQVTGVHGKFHIMLQHGPRAVRVGSQKL